MLADNRAQFYLDLPSDPFYGFNRPGAKPIPGVIQNWWRQGMMGSAKAHYEGIKAFSETDFTEDLKIIDVPTLVMHGDDDQVVPIADSAPLSAKLLKNSTLKVYEKFPHGMCTTQADVVNPDLHAFIAASISSTPSRRPVDDARRLARRAATACSSWLAQARLVPPDALDALKTRAMPGELNKVADQARTLREWFRRLRS